MAEENLPQINGAYAPMPHELAEIKQRYKVKFGYYFMSGFVLLVVSIGLSVLYDLQNEGIYFMGLTLDGTIFSIYLIGVVVVSIGLRMRAGVCVLCQNYKFPLLNHNGYCDKCGAALFKHEVFEKQEIVKAARDIGLEERLIEMANQGNTEAVHTLVSKGIDINYRDKYGNTALMYAAMANHLDTLNLLLMAAADPWLKNNFGLNALMLAVDKGHVSSTKRLLQLGADPEERTNDGRTLIDIAKNRKSDELIELINGFSG